MPSAETAAEFSPPPEGWTLFGGLERPRSRGRIRLTGPRPVDPIEIETNFLSDPHDIKVAVACIDICREVGNSASMKQFAKREVMPGNLRGAELENFIRNAASTYWHQTGTAKMGRDEMSVVDGTLKVHGIEGLRIADASVMPRITTGTPWPPASLSASAPDKCCDPSTNSRRLRRLAPGRRRRRYWQNDPGGGVRWMVTHCG
ncbi:MAG: choline dehydrogenase [Bradyrhizobium sp.]|nr:choline dehydrogenase [Bradyrhizobium sp.]